MVQPENIFEHQRPSYWDGHFIGVCNDVQAENHFGSVTPKGALAAEVALRQFFASHNKGFEVSSYSHGQEFNPVDFAVGTVVQMQIETMAGKGPEVAKYARYGGPKDILMPGSYVHSEHQSLAIYGDFADSMLLYTRSREYGVVVPPERRRNAGANTLYVVSADAKLLENQSQGLAGSMRVLLGSQQLGATRHFKTRSGSEAMYKISKLGVLHKPTPRGKRRRIFDLGMLPRSAFSVNE